MERYLTEDEQARLCKVLKGAAVRGVLARRDDAVMRALIHSGLRIGEFSKVTVGQALAALRVGYLFVPREHRKGVSKGAADDHRVFMTRPLRLAVEDLLRVRHAMRPQDCREADPLVLSRQGGALTVRSFELRMAAWGREAGLPPGFSPHWLRHTHAMNIIRRSTAKNPLGIVQRALGHRSVSSTGVYTEPSREEVDAALAETAGAGGRVSLSALRRAWEGRVAP
jgi:site-specific recombinase XerC